MDHLIAATYRAEQQHFWFRGLARFTAPLIAQAVAGVTQPEILDCGCGTGANIRRLAPFGCVTGFHLQSAGLQFALLRSALRLLNMPIGSSLLALARRR